MPIAHGATTGVEAPAAVEQVSTDVEDSAEAYTPIAHGATGSEVEEPTPVEQVSTDVDVNPTTTYNDGLWTPSTTSTEEPTSTESASESEEDSTTSERTRRSSSFESSSTSTSTTSSSTSSSSSSSSSSPSSSSSSSSPSSSSTSTHSKSHSSSTDSEAPLLTESSSASAKHDDGNGVGVAKPLIITGVIVGVLLLAGLLWMWRRKRNRRRQDDAFGIPVGTSDGGGGWGGFFHRNRSETDLGFDEPGPANADMQERGYGAVSRWDGQYDDRYDSSARDENVGQWSDLGSQHDDYANMAGVGVASAAAAAGATHYGQQQRYQDEPLSSASGNRVRRKQTPPANSDMTRSDDLDQYLAASRTGYTPEEAQQEFPQAYNASQNDDGSLVGGMFRTLSSAGQRNSRGSYDEAQYSRRQSAEPQTPPGQRAYGFNDIDPTHINYPALATPQSVQRNDASTTRDVQRESAGDFLTGSPSKASRAVPPGSLRPHSGSPTNNSPLSPPLQPHLFYSSTSSAKGPGVAMPPASEAPPTSLSINGLAAYLYPSTSDMQQQQVDNLTAIPTTRSPRKSSGVPQQQQKFVTPTQRKRDARNQEAFRQVDDIVQAGSAAREDGRLLHDANASDDESLHDLLQHISNDKRSSRY